MAQWLPFALAVAGLTPQQFKAFTLFEWGCFVRGWEAKNKNERSERAWYVANIMASSGNLKKGTSVKDVYHQLLGEEVEDKTPKGPSMTPEEAEKLRKRFGA